MQFKNAEYYKMLSEFKLGIFEKKALKYVFLIFINKNKNKNI